MYKWGDLTCEAHRTEREQLEAELGGRRVATSQAEVLVRAASFLKDLPAAWSASTSAQRNALARLVFASIEIEDDRVTAVMPQPDFAPFFVQRVRPLKKASGRRPRRYGPRRIQFIGAPLSGRVDIHP